MWNTNNVEEEENSFNGAAVMTTLNKGGRNSFKFNSDM